MKKIAIYGDSYGSYLTKWDTGKILNEQLGLSWVEILENAGYNITNFSLTGSAFLFSYEKYLENYKNFDLNIFISTHPNRVYVKELDGLLLFTPQDADNHYNIIKKRRYYQKQKDHLDILNSVKVYMLKWMDLNLTTKIQQGLVNNLWNLSSNTIVIPVVKEAVENSSKGLFDLSLEELKLCDEISYRNIDFNNFICKRKCHFSEENNKVLAELVLDAIEKNKKIIELDNFLIQKPGKDFSFYVGTKK